MHSLADVADDLRCGGKARGLAKLIAAGLPVPPGIVIDSRAFASFVGELRIDATSTEPSHDLAHRLAAVADAHMPPALLADVQRRVSASLLAVRSSATIEDTAAGAGAGLFSSSGRVLPEQLTEAIKMVWQSALSAAVAAYARRRDASVEIAVIVQPFVEGELVTVYTRPPGAPTKDEVVVQRGASLERLARSSTEDIVQLALRAEAAIGATGGADVEIIHREPLAIVQARPIIHPRAAARTPMPAPLLAALVADGRKWTWDVSHNPDPLSVAQAELVDRVDRAGVAPYSMRTVSGFLYSAPREPGPSIDAHDVLERVAQIEHRIVDALGLQRHPEFGPVFAPTETTTLQDAIARYIAFYKIWAGELSPLITAARRRAAQRAHDPTSVTRSSAVEATLKKAARGELKVGDVLRRVGMLAPAWDVSVPTYAEQPRLLLEAVNRARQLLVPLADPSKSRRPFFAAEGPIAAARRALTSSQADEDGAVTANIVADLAERDDVWFARAQWLVRVALKWRGRDLGLDDGDVFWVPFDDLIAGIDPESARRRSAGARAAATRAAKWDPPLVVHGEVLHEEAPSAGATSELRGIGAGVGRASGSVVKYANLASAVMAKPGDVIVARAITPALAVMVIGCAAIVSETGGLLDHGAAMARELGIPCVVGCRDAWRLLEDGALVEVDGDAGIVSVRD
ncbi:hypothetical protein BH11MYX2_BH11MYX2_05400 [soil metagenome]